MRELGPVCLLALGVAALTGCASPPRPGLVTAEIPSEPVRLDAARAAALSGPTEERAHLLRRVVVETRSLAADTSADASGRVLLQDDDYNAWVTEFERAFVRGGASVIDRLKLIELQRERRISSEQAARLLGADALFQINVLEVLPRARRVDLRPHRLVRRSGSLYSPLEEWTFSDFSCRIDAKLILSSGEVAWSGELHYPASALTVPGSLQVAADVLDQDDPRGQVLEASQPGRPNPRLELRWRDEVEQVVPTDRLPAGLDPGDQQLLRVVTRFAARACVDELLRAPEDEPPGAR